MASQILPISIPQTSFTKAPDQLNGHVILGGGVCGCLLARELLERSRAPVWLIEAGGRQEENAIDRSQPARWLHLLGSSDDDAHCTMPNANLAGRSLTWPRGRGLGGSGRINAMIWVPPQPKDFLSLTNAGLDERALQRAWRRACELVAVEPARYLSDAAKQFLAAVDNHPALGTFAAYVRINRHGRRWTTETLLQDFLQANPAATARLHCLQATAQRVNIRSGRVRGLVLQSGPHLREFRIASDAHVISCLGTLATPALLMSSGIGDPNLLANGGIPTQVESAGVGQNLHDHLIMPVVYSRTTPPFLPGPASEADTLQWDREGTGPLASNVAECGGFDPGKDFQLHVTPTDYLRYPRESAPSAMTLGVQLTRPHSRGWIQPVGTQDAVEFEIHSNYMSDPADVTELPNGVHWVRRLAGLLTESGVIGGERVPGARRRDANQLVAAIARYAQTLYHPGGTCRIGNDDKAVTNSDFRVNGVEGLSIVDASLLPQPTVGNPTGSLAMLTCYAADQMLTPRVDQ